MRLLLKIAFFNLWRRRSRSIMVIMMVGMATTGLILVQGFYSGMIAQVVDSALRSDTGHISIYHKEYRKSKSIEHQISQPDTLIAYIETQPEVTSIIKRVTHDGLVATAKKSQRTFIRGTDLENEARHARLNEKLIEGEYSFGKRGRGALIGAELADKLKVKVGKKIIITIQDVNKEINSLRLKVRGILRTNDVKIDKYGVFIDANMLQVLAGIEGKTTQISLMVNKREMQEPMVKRLQKQFGNDEVKVYSWTTIMPMFESYESLEGVMFGISFFIVFVVATLGIFGVILVSVLERVREFGIMLAIGSSFNRVRWQIILEAMMLGFIGWFLAAFVSALMLDYLTQTGLDFSAYNEALKDYGMDPVIKADFKASYFLNASVTVVLATFFAALWPIRMLRKMNPIEAVNA